MIELVPEPIPPLGYGEVLLRVEAAALNHSELFALNGGHWPEGPVEGWADRFGDGLVGHFPMSLGYEGAGVVVDAAPGAGMTVGTRVCWAAVVGSCADYVVAPASLLVPVPDRLTTEEAARVPSAGATAQLLTRVWPLAGRSAVVWGAAGPVGRMLTAFLGDGGARVIGVASGHRARVVAELDGAHAVDRDAEDVVEAVRFHTGGRGAAAVFDPIGAAVYDTNLAMLGRRGCLVNYGQLSGRLPSVDLMDLADKGLFLTMFGGGGRAYLDERDELISLVARALRLALVRPAVVSEVGGRYGLVEAPDAYEALAAGPSGKVLVIPDLGTPDARF